MKKVLYITTISNTINSFLIPHIKMLIDNGYSVDCACSINKEIDKSLLDNNVKVYDVPFSRNPLAVSNIKAYRELVKLQKRNKYDIIHVHTPIAAFWGRLLKVKFKKLIIVYTAHGFHFYKGAPLKNWLVYYTIEKLEARLTDVIITINDEDYNIAKNKFKNENNKIYKINGVGVDLDKYKKIQADTEGYRKKLNLQKEDFVICIVGELNKNKNQIQAIRTIKSLYMEYKNVKLLLAGDGKYEKKLSIEIEKMHLDNNVKLLGYRNDIIKIINCSDVVASFSYREGLPKCLLEAMAIGKPIISTNIRGNRDLVKHNYNGLLVEVNNIVETRNAIIRLLNSRQIRENFGRNTLEMVKRFELSRITNYLKEIYLSINKWD